MTRDIEISAPWDHDRDTVPATVRFAAVCVVVGLGVAAGSAGLGNPALSWMTVWLTAAVGVWGLGVVATAWPRRNGVLRARLTEANLKIVGSPWQGRMRLVGPLLLLAAALGWVVLGFDGMSRNDFYAVAALTVVGLIGLVDALPLRQPAAVELSVHGVRARAGKTTVDLAWSDLRGVTRGPNGRTIDFASADAFVPLPATELRSDPALVAHLIEYLRRHPADRHRLDDDLVRRALGVPPSLPLE